ncbi:hypothetical protein SAMN05216215_1018157 [Saccharopolyspora shandongensis]|uniref:Uncharacterized protein n=1 Tax=Saccharopolyspora shandongensis TaxID=418495 RepID=A0A1H3GG89_9PSEU|nr:hypothetical protein [Saccharopolyspora shandongensis]SDY02035.1 hypothetical protein SAMN05216215_1018157 [Saccharopolyspora shandongensis]
MTEPNTRLVYGSSLEPGHTMWVNNRHGWGVVRNAATSADDRGRRVFEVQCADGEARTFRCSDRGMVKVQRPGPVTRRLAEAVLAEIKKAWRSSMPKDGPTLRDYTHGEVSLPGSWSIDWEDGDAPYNWPWLFTERQHAERTVPLGVHLEAISGVVLGIYPNETT